MQSTVESGTKRLKALIWVAFHLEAGEIIDQYVELSAKELESHGHEVVICRSLDEAMKQIEDADIMLCWRILPELFANAKKLKWIQFGSASLDHTIFPELLDSSVVMTNVSGIHLHSVPEHVIALMLALGRYLNVAFKQQMERRYDRSTIAPRADELFGKTAGILGLGRIGLEIARLSKGLGMHVIGTKRTAEGVPDYVDYVDEVLSPTMLDEVLSRSDYLVIVLPLTDSTKALLGRREIDLMKNGARIINVARGAMIETEALLRALNRGKLSGAALDVFTEEPLPPESPLYDHPNVILTPHVAGSHRAYSERAFEIFKANLAAFETGGQMINIFDRTRGY